MAQGVHPRRDLAHGPDRGPLMRVVLMVEGKTEKVFMPVLRSFLEPRLPGKMPRLVPNVYDGRLPKGEKLRRRVQLLLQDTKNPADAVIALTDVYTGGDDFIDAVDARTKMRQWVGDEHRFYPHAASTTSKPGCCHTGKPSRSCRVQTFRHPMARPSRSITNIHQLIGYKTSSGSERRAGIIPSPATHDVFWMVKI